MLLLVSFLLAYAGFAAFCATTKRHVRQVWKTPPSQAKLNLMRAAAWVLVFAAWPPCIAYWDFAMGTVAWVCMLPLAALALVWPFTYYARPSVLAGGAAAVLAGVLFAAHSVMA